jgi:hypothetical protein
MHGGVRSVSPQIKWPISEPGMSSPGLRRVGRASWHQPGYVQVAPSRTNIASCLTPHWLRTGGVFAFVSL